MPAAARFADAHVCPMTTPKPHVGGLIEGRVASSVKIGHRNAATQGSTCACSHGLLSRNTIAEGSTTVFIHRRPAARMGDRTTHGGMIISGYPKVLIG